MPSSLRLNRAVVLDEQHHVAGVVTDAEVVRRLGIPGYHVADAASSSGPGIDR
jgi:hypothetical protein